MRPLLVVINAPSFTDIARFSQAGEPMPIQTLITELPIEALNESVLHRLARINEAQRNATHGRPLIQRLARELWPVVHDDVQRLPPSGSEPLQHSHPKARPGQVTRRDQGVVTPAYDDGVDIRRALGQFR